uniref:Uncharacterized protein n=1 Tax=Anguilla anguilla TaxID=7936 RepID=A0A0E9WH62_ANGAN
MFMHLKCFTYMIQAWEYADTITAIISKVQQVKLTFGFGGSIKQPILFYGNVVHFHKLGEISFVKIFMTVII